MAQPARLSRPPCAQVEVDGSGSWLEIGLPRSLAWTRITLAVADLDPSLDGLRIVHLSDLHLRPRWADGYDRLIDRIAANPPDLICFTGDFVEDKRDYRPALPTLIRLMQALPSRLGTYAIPGNHDGDLLPLHFSAMNVHDATGRRIRVRRIELLGFPGVDRSDLDDGFLADLPPRQPGDLRIALCHYPDLFERIAACGPDLYLCGHSHGGQVCLPGGIPILTHDRSPRCFVSGVHRRGDTWFIANRGLGAGSIPIRLFCPAEAIEITVRAAGG